MEEWRWEEVEGEGKERRDKRKGEGSEGESGGGGARDLREGKAGRVFGRKPGGTKRLCRCPVRPAVPLDTRKLPSPARRPPPLSTSSSHLHTHPLGFAALVRTFHRPTLTSNTLDSRQIHPLHFHKPQKIALENKPKLHKRSINTLLKLHHGYIA